MSKISVNCYSCGRVHQIWPYQLKANKHYCNNNCKNKTKQYACATCGNEFYSSFERSFCSRSCSAKTNNKKRIRTKWTEQQKNNLSSIKKNSLFNKSRKRDFSILHYKSCSMCNSTFFVKQKSSPKKTCSTKCRSLACNGIRTYQNGSRKPSWYFCKEQNKNVLLESSWEVEVANYLDSKNIKWIRPDPIPYILDKVRHYYPDFYLVDYEVFLDPKNPYCMNKDEAKLKEVSKKIKLKYGDKNDIINFINSLIYA